MKTKVFDLRRLRYFQSIALVGSFAAASRSLNIAQPALSHQISELERNLGAAVFKRTARGVELTEIGSLLLQHANSVLSQVAAAERALGDYIAETTSKKAVRIGITPTLYDLAPALMTKFAADLSKIDLIVSEARAHDSKRLIADGKLDIAITFEENNWPGGLPLGWERMCLVALPDNHGTTPPTIEFEELSHLDDLIMPIPNTRMRELLDEASERAGLRMNFALEISGLRPRMQAVLEGFGRTILPLRNVERECRSGNLFARTIVNPTLDRRIVVHATENVSPDFVHQLRTFLSRLLGEYGSEPQL